MLKRHTAVPQVLHQILLKRANLILAQYLWHGNVARFNQLLDQIVFQLVGSLAFLLSGDFRLNILAQIIHRSVWPGLGGELVVQFRQLYLINFFDSRFENYLSACQIFSMIVLGKSQLNIFFVASLRTN